MRKMYSEEQVKKIAETAVATALEAMGVEPNEHDGIDIEGLLTSESIVGKNAAFFSSGDPTAYVGTDAVLMTGDASLGFDPKEAMSNFYATTTTVRIGGLLGGTMAVFNTDGIRIDVEPASNQYIVFSGIPTMDPEIPGAIWCDETTGTLKISSLK